MVDSAGRFAAGEAPGSGVANGARGVGVNVGKWESMTIRREVGSVPPPNRLQAKVPITKQEITHSCTFTK